MVTVVSLDIVATTESFVFSDWFHQIIWSVLLINVFGPSGTNGAISPTGFIGLRGSIGPTGFIGSIGSNGPRDSIRPNYSIGTNGSTKIVFLLEPVAPKFTVAPWG